MVLTTCSFIVKDQINLYQFLEKIHQENLIIVNCVISLFGNNYCISINLENNGNVNLTNIIRGYQLIRENNYSVSQDKNTVKIISNIINEPKILINLIDIIFENNYEIDFLEYSAVNQILELKLKIDKNISNKTIKESFNKISKDDILLL